MLFGFFVSSRALLVQNASFLTPLYLGKNYAYRKRIVKHISKLHFSTPKNVNVSLTENLQLADTAPVLLFRAWRESFTSYSARDLRCWLPGILHFRATFPVQTPLPRDWFSWARSEASLSHITSHDVRKSIQLRVTL